MHDLAILSKCPFSLVRPHSAKQSLLTRFVKPVCRQRATAKVACLTTSTVPKSTFCYSDWKNWSLCLCYDGFVRLPDCLTSVQKSSSPMFFDYDGQTLNPKIYCRGFKLLEQQIYINLSATCVWPVVHRKTKK